MNLLVTGGAGFIGSHFVRHALRRGVERLVNLDCLTYAGRLENLEDVAEDPRYLFEQVDLRDLPSVRRVVRQHQITHIVHLAAESHVDRSIAAPADFVSTNILGTFNLLEASRENPIRRFLHVSTDEVFGALDSEGVFTESSPYAPNSPYSASKAASDMLVRSYVKTYGLEAIITHCSNNFGPGQHGEKLIPRVIQAALQGTQIPVYGDGRQVRDWIYVEDHAHALWEVLERGRPGEHYNIGARKELRNIELVGMICDLVDELNPKAGAGARSLISFVRDRPGHDFRYALDTTRIEQELGWRPQHEFQSALRTTVDWYLQRWREGLPRGDWHHPVPERSKAI